MKQNIFPIRSVNRLAHLLGLSKERLREIADTAPTLYRQGQLLLPYKETRPINVPVPALAAIQKRLLERVFSDFRPHDCSYGGIQGRSPADNAAMHLDKLYVLKIDVRKFYTHVHHRWVQQLFERRLECIPPVASILRRLVTLHGGLPQGTCTSPALADQILRPLDTRLQNALASRGITYTRWVDDMTFSAMFSLRSYISFVQNLLRPYGLSIHRKGEKAPQQFGPGEYAIVTGLSCRGRIAVAESYTGTVKKELRIAWRFAEGHCAETPPYGRETYWGTIRYIARYSQRQAKALKHLFDQVKWEQLKPLALPGKRGRVVFAEKPGHAWIFQAFGPGRPSRTAATENNRDSVNYGVSAEMGERGHCS